MAGKLVRKLLNPRLAIALLPVLFLVYIFGITMHFTLNDPDLWWHLKTGEYIVANWEVPDVDPFAYTTPRPLAESQKIGLRAQWLGQVIFYLSYSIGGLLGVGVMRNLLIITPMLILYIWLSRNGLKPLTSLVVIALPAFFLGIQLFYSFERPQGLSFCLVLVVVILLERLKRQSIEGDPGATLRPDSNSTRAAASSNKKSGIDPSFWLLPLVMALWSNIHPGFIVGNVIIMIYLGVGVLTAGFHILKGSKPLRPVFFFLIICIAAIAASFLNPNTYKLFYSYFTGMVSMFFKNVAALASGGSGGGWVESVVLEYKPLYYFYKNLGYKWLSFYWIFTGILYAAMFIKYWLRRKFDITEFLVVSFAVFFANRYARGLMFSLTILPFYMGKTIAELKLPALKFRVLSKGIITALLVLTVGFCTYTYKQTPFVFKPGITKRWITPWYPVRLVRFLKTAEIAGPMYNFYTWGGFLIWSLYPEHRVFIDGRAIDDWINRTADGILKAYSGWSSKLDAYNINFIVIPVVFRESGHAIPLATALANDDRWKLVFIKSNSALFVRDVPQNKKLIFKFNRDKKAIYQEIINVENLLLSGTPWNPVYNVTKANALFALGRYAEAKAIYKRFPMQGAHGLQRLKDMGY